jgi:hypothetical protein
MHMIADIHGTNVDGFIAMPLILSFPNVSHHGEAAMASMMTDGIALRTQD